MRIRAALLSSINEPLAISDVEIGDPQFGEVFVQMAASKGCPLAGGDTRRHRVVKALLC